jgi:MFS family permease
MVGNVLEWYDFAAYGFLAATFAGNFFPLESHLLSLMASFGVFAVAFVTRPLGGVLFGHIGDRVGRRTALIISVLVMAVPSFAIGLLPTYASTWAPPGGVTVEALQRPKIGRLLLGLALLDDARVLAQLDHAGRTPGHSPRFRKG